MAAGSTTEADFCVGATADAPDVHRGVGLWGGCLPELVVRKSPGGSGKAAELQQEQGGVISTVSWTATFFPFKNCIEIY